jgi:hypothetical protein
MGSRTFRIELRVEFDDETKYDLIRGALRSTARKLLTQAVMIADVRRPQVYIESDSFAEGNEKISLSEDET